MYCEEQNAQTFLSLISKEFLLLFKENLIQAFGFNDTIDFNSDETWCNVGGTIGWGNAFTKTCNEFKLDELLSYYDHLDWYDSDNFDADVGDIAVQYGLILPISEQTDET